MPDLEPLSFSSRDGPSENDEFGVKGVCSGRRHPCVWLFSPSARLTAALYHVQELKAAMESHKSGSPAHQREGAWQRPPKALRFYRRSEEWAELIVKGSAISVRRKHDAATFVDSSSPWPLMKRILRVLDEVVHLVERLEADRQESHQTLSKEKERKRFLLDKLHSSSPKSRRELCSDLLKEREVCVGDVGELTLQLKMEKEKVEEVQQKVKDNELLKQLLNSEVTFSHAHIPLLQEKLDQERGSIEVLQRRRMEAEAVWSKKQSDLAQIKKELIEKDLEMCQEKLVFEKTLLVKKNQLEEKLGNLNHLRLLEDNLRAERTSAESLISVMKEKFDVITFHIPDVTQQQKEEEEEISRLLLKVAAQIKSNGELKETLFLLQEVVDKKKMDGEKKVFHIKEQLQSKLTLSSVVGRDNVEQKHRLLDYEAKISDSEGVVKLMHEERKWMIRQITSNAQQWEKAKVEVGVAAAHHSVISIALEEEQRRSFTEEQNARILVETLRKEVTTQKMSQQLLKTQCVQMKEEMEKLQRNGTQTNKQLHSEFQDVSAETKALENKVQKMFKLTESLDQLEDEHTKTLFRIEKQKAELQDQLRSAQNQETDLKKSFEQTEILMRDVMEKREQNQQSSGDVMTSMEKIPESIVQLQRSLEEVEFKHRSAASLTVSVQSLKETKLRLTQRTERIYWDQQEVTRQEVMETQEMLTAALKENEHLAKCYSHLQQVLMENKLRSVSAHKHRNNRQNTLLYFTKLLLLQRTMHEMLVKSFKHQMNVSEGELGHCRHLYGENGRKIQMMKDGLSEEIYSSGMSSS